ncbi:hypothetical protein CEE45_03550 [Candidatus Heimdallarchaeota archaeon B3_Heim]|nr:MAG: hypothetical protein CEE45_03550 [Candidatus Heimdallarchaeota archaeon B3_Heim]
MKSIDHLLDLRGTYILALEVCEQISLQIKRLQWNISPRIYLYFGSAKGSTATSLENRLRRHFNSNKKKFWHIDYLTTHSSVILHRAYVNINEQSTECQNLTIFAKNVEFEIVVRFGNSDCSEKCGGHLGFLPDNKNNISWLDDYFKYWKWSIISGFLEKV